MNLWVVEIGLLEPGKVKVMLHCYGVLATTEQEALALGRHECTAGLEMFERQVVHARVSISERSVLSLPGRLATKRELGL